MKVRRLRCADGDLIGHLFRLLYHILRFIDQSDIDQDEKDSYAKILPRIWRIQNLCCCFITA